MCACVCESVCVRRLYNEAAKDRCRVCALFNSRGPIHWSEKAVLLSGAGSLGIRDLRGGSAPSKSLSLTGSVGDCSFSLEINLFGLPLSNPLVQMSSSN